MTKRTRDFLHGVDLGAAHDHPAGIVLARESGKSSEKDIAVIVRQPRDRGEKTK